MGGWLYRLHHDRKFFIRLRKRVLWILVLYPLALGLWTGVLPAAVKDPLGVFLFRGHPGLGTFIFGGLFPILIVYMALILMEEINKAGEPKPPSPWQSDETGQTRPGS